MRIFFTFQKNVTFRFFKMTCQEGVKSRQREANIEWEHWAVSDSVKMNNNIKQLHTYEGVSEKKTIINISKQLAFDSRMAGL